MTDLAGQVEAPAERKYTLRVLLALLLMMITAATIGVLVFTKTSLRLDEAQSLFQVSRDIPGMLNLVAQDVHVPGYHLLLHAWTTIFGHDIAIARYLSLVFFVVSIPAIFVLATQVFDKRVGLFAALLLTISPFMQWYGSEARMYSMLAFITILHQIFMLKVFRAGKPVHWVWFAITALIGIYTHYFFWFVLLIDVVFYLLYRKKFPRHSFAKFVVTAGLTVAAIAPWLIYVVRLGLASNTQPALSVPSSGDLFDTYAQFIFGFQVNYLNTIIISLWPAIVIFAFFALRKNHRVTPAMILFVITAVLPVLGAFVISILIKPFFLSRYLIVALPALLILISWFLSIYTKGLRIFLQIGLVVATLCLLTVEILSPNTPVKEDYSQAVAYLNTHASSQDVIVAAAPFTIYPIEYYYTGPAKLTTQPIWDRFVQGAIPSFNPADLAAQTNKNVSSYREAWLILSYDQGYNEKIRHYYDTHYQRLSAKTFSPGLAVYEYKVRYDPLLTLNANE